MKKILLVALTLFTVFMFYVLIGGFLQKQQKENNPNSGTASKTISPTANTDTFTISEISNHNTDSDCWLIINDKIYSVGKYLNEHPGGASVITPYCGKEASKAFDTQDRGSRSDRHSGQATQMLGDYLVGSIKTN